ncbi:MAG: DUF3857 domain-containing protein [Bacteroidia bacterium]|nr:DUF3857 domain-containing protein [Bacteroidia bacterium]
MKTHLPFIFFVLFALPSYSQWKEISEEAFNIEQVTYSKFDNPDAVYLFHNGGIDFPTPLMLQKSHYSRVHILNEVGVEALSTLEIIIPAQKGNFFFRGGRTINMEEGKIKTTYLKEDGIFIDEIMDGVLRIRLVFPKVKQGSIIEYKYSISTSRFLSTTWTFQKDYPVLESNLRFNPFQAYEYQVVLKGAEVSKVASRNYFGGANLAIKDVPALKSESYVSNLDDYRTRAIFQLVKYVNQDVSQDFFESWPALSDELLKRLEAPAVKATKKINKKYYSDIPLEMPPNEKMEAIYTRLTKQMAWDSTFRSYSVGKKLAKTYKNGKANSAEINLILTYLLRNQNIEAYPVLISTIYHGKAIKVYPIIDQFNHLVCMVMIDGKRYILDAASGKTDYRKPPMYILGQEGFILKKDKISWTRVSVPIASSNEIHSEIYLEEASILTGNVFQKLDGYNASIFRESMENDDDDSEDEEEVEISNFTIDGLKQNLPEITIGYNFESLDLANQIGELVTIDLFKLWRRKANPFTDDERIYPIDMLFPSKEKKIIKFFIPEGYDIESGLKEKFISLKYGELVYSLKISHNEQERTYLLESLFQTNNYQFPAEKNQELRDFFNEMISLESELLVLKKSSNENE